MKKPIFISLILIVCGQAIADDVPVIIWGPHIQHEPAIALKSHDGYELMDILRERSTAETITFIIAEDQLSVEDLSQCKAPNGQTCFKGLQNIESKLYIPSVVDPASEIRDVVALDPIEANVLSNGNFTETLNHQPGKYFFVNFDDDDYIEETKSMKLTRHDQMITSFYKDFLLRNDRDLVVVYTGKQATHHRRVREAFGYMAVGDPNTTTKPSIWKTERVLLYYVSLELEDDESLNQRLNVTAVSHVEPSIQENNGTNAEAGQGVDGTNEADNGTTIYSDRKFLVSMSVNYDDHFEFYIIKKSGYWWADLFKWNNESLSSKTPISAANGFSYHCRQPIRIANENETIVIRWEGLQLQPKFAYVQGEKLTSFADPYDCVGFVSIPILSGFCVVFLLLFVLFIGILCMLDIKPNDRFDNPKGKTITVNVDDLQK